MDADIAKLRERLTKLEVVLAEQAAAVERATATAMVAKLLGVMALRFACQASPSARATVAQALAALEQDTSALMPDAEANLLLLDEARRQLLAARSAIGL